MYLSQLLCLDPTAQNEFDKQRSESQWRGSTQIMCSSSRILAGAAGEFSSPELTLCADSFVVSILPL